MHDWTVVVRESLKKLGLRRDEEQEVVAELAAHLEDTYDEQRRAGMSDDEAFRYAVEQAVGLKASRRDIRRAKRQEEIMNLRTRTLWLPALATLFASSTLLMLLQRFAFLHPKTWIKDEGTLVIALPWLLLLPFCGALGAHLSLRTGGRRLTSVLAGISPSIIMLAVFCVLLPFGILVQKNPYIIHHPAYFVLATFNWTVVPGVPLLLGVAAAWRFSSKEHSLETRPTECGN